MSLEASSTCCFREQNGHLGGAGLDVYEFEAGYFFENLAGRVIQDDRLARLQAMPNVLITSHQAFLTIDALNAIAKVTLGNVAEFAEGKRGEQLTNNVPAPKA
jgi:D-lactate dehydrogenase